MDVDPVQRRTRVWGLVLPRYGDWRDSFSGSSTAGLVCRECHALVAHRGDHPQQHLAWHERRADRQR